LPLTQFDIQYEDHKKNRPYTFKPRSSARDANADKVKKDMKAEQVLDLLGAPDFVGYDTWEYDMDSSPPSSLTLKWDVRQVTDVQRKTPALWKDGFVRDEQIIW
jgi:outer membrane protein assembly factor BamE (lipoprotein component of BamABCDE complex)